MTTVDGEQLHLRRIKSVKVSIVFGLSNMVLRYNSEEFLASHVSFFVDSCEKYILCYSRTPQLQLQ